MGDVDNTNKKDQDESLIPTAEIHNNEQSMSEKVSMVFKNVIKLSHQSCFAGVFTDQRLKVLIPRNTDLMLSNCLFFQNFYAVGKMQN